MFFKDKFHPSGRDSDFVGSREKTGTFLKPKSRREAGRSMKYLPIIFLLAVSGCNLLYNVPYPHNDSHLQRAEFFMAKSRYYERKSYFNQQNGNLSASVNYILKMRECNLISDQYIQLADQELLEQERQMKMLKELLNDIQKLKALTDSTPPAK